MIAENIANLRLLVFISGIVYPKFNSYCFTLYMIIQYLMLLKQQQVFRLQAVSANSLKKFFNEGEIHDINSTIVVGGNRLQSGVKFAVVDAETKGQIRRKVFVISKDLPENYTLLNFTLFYNLGETALCTFRKCREQSISFANEVEMSLIGTSTDWGQFVVDNILKNYFENPKLLYKGDIIAIDLKEYGKELFHVSSRLNNVDETVYFKCNNIIFNEKSVSGGYLCAVDKSTLKLTTNVQSFIPKNTCDIIESWIGPSYPDALENYFEDMKKAVDPFIVKRDLNFQPIFLVEGRKGSGKSLLVQCIASYFGMHVFTINNFDVSANVYAQNETKLRNAFFGAKMAAPCILEIRNFENFGKNNEGQYDERLINHFINELVNYFDNNELPVILFCCSNEKNIPLELKRVFLKIFELKAPNEEEREKMLRWILKSSNYQTSINLINIANKTHGFLYEDLRALVDHSVTDFHQVEKKYDCNDIPAEYFLKALDFMQSNYNESLGAPKVPKVAWSDVGGLNDVKEEIIKTIKLPLRHPQLLKSSGLKRTGILLFGPPGTGKTLIAKAVATECGLCFLSVKGPELLNMYVGQSEQNVREVFERAREASPCIIFFDELDSLAPNRGASGDSGGVMDRVVSQLLAEMDGLNRAGIIFIIGATNRPDLIDPALLRPGRFDKLLYVGPCTDRVSKVAVLEALTRKFKFSEDLALDSLVDLCPESFSGADLYGICSSAWMSAVRSLIIIMENESSEKASVSLEDVVVTLEDFKNAIKTIKPSISQQELDYFHRLKADFK